VSEAAALARDVGDRGMFNWLVGMTAIFEQAEGRRWDENMAALREALDAATILNDRLRLRLFLGVYEGARGEDPTALLREVEEMVGETTEPEQLFILYMVRNDVALRRRDLDGAFRWAAEAHDLQSQSPEVAADAALHAAARARHPEYIRDVARRATELKASGAYARSYVAQGQAAVAAISGNVAEAAARYAEIDAELERMGQRYYAAVVAIDAVTLLPDLPEIRARAESARPLLEELGAVSDLAYLDTGLGMAEPAEETRSADTTASAAARQPGG